MSKARTTTPTAINAMMAFRLPSAYFSGVRVHSLDEAACTTRVRHRWFNQNPFASIYFAVLAMAAELSTGALLIAAIRAQEQAVSMLVARNRAVFHKKARGTVQFTCTDGALLEQALQAALATGEGRTVWAHTTGTDAQGEVVAEFDFEWTIKARTPKPPQDAL